MPDARYIHYLGSARLRLGKLQQRVGRISSRREDSVTTAVIEELQQALTQLQTACEELRRLRADTLAIRSQAEHERQRFLEFFDFVPEPALITDRKLTIEYANQGASSLLNVSAAALRGKAFELFLGGDRVEILNRLNSTTPPLEHEVWLRPRERKPRSVRAVVAPIHTPGGECLQWLLVPSGAADQPESQRPTRVRPAEDVA